MSADMMPFAQRAPFDAIRQVRDDGSEYWSGRDLMSLLGYASWEFFTAATDRARASASNVGQDVRTLFRGVQKKSTGGRPADDVHLTRFAVYLIAMNGDPRKPEIAAAQTYFAVRTREAETAQALTIPQTMSAALRLAADEHDARVLAEHRVTQLEPAADAFEAMVAADGLLTMKQAAEVLGYGVNRLFEIFRMMKILYRNNHGHVPYHGHDHHFEVKLNSYRDGDGITRVTATPMVQPNALPYLRKRLGSYEASLGRAAAGVTR
jgi:DNA-damage-inducible protein D